MLVRKLVLRESTTPSQMSTPLIMLHRLLPMTISEPMLGVQAIAPNYLGNSLATMRKTRKMMNLLMHRSGVVAVLFGNLVAMKTTTTTTMMMMMMMMTTTTNWKFSLACDQCTSTIRHYTIYLWIPLRHYYPLLASGFFFRFFIYLHTGISDSYQHWIFTVLGMD